MGWKTTGDEAMPATTTQNIANVLHLGRLPIRARRQLEVDGGLLYCAEGIWESAVLVGFKAPGYYIDTRKMGFIGSFALSDRRVIARAGFYNKIDVNLMFEDPRFKEVIFKVRPKYLSMKFDASIQMPRATGDIEIRLHLPDIAKAAEILESKGAVVKR
jgi:hypothetical protein